MGSPGPFNGRKHRTEVARFGFTGTLPPVAGKPVPRSAAGRGQRLAGGIRRVAEKTAFSESFRKGGFFFQEPVDCRLGNGKIGRFVPDLKHVLPEHRTHV